MSQPLVFLDLEGTGVDPYTDRIVEMAFHDGERFLLNERVNPRRPIPAEASAVHGIHDHDVVGLPAFPERAAEVQSIVDGAVLVGYSLVRYDTILLDRELRMAGEAGLARDADGIINQPEIDLYGIWQRVESRKLTTAAKRFAGIDLDRRGDPRTAAGRPGGGAGPAAEGAGMTITETIRVAEPCSEGPVTYAYDGSRHAPLTDERDAGNGTTEAHNRRSISEPWGDPARLPEDLTYTGLARRFYDVARSHWTPVADRLKAFAALCYAVACILAIGAAFGVQIGATYERERHVESLRRIVPVAEEALAAHGAWDEAMTDTLAMLGEVKSR